MNYPLRELVEEWFPTESRHWRVGTRTRHPDGYEVEITDGQYWGLHGLSNFWYWTRLDTGERCHGYGW